MPLKPRPLAFALLLPLAAAAQDEQGPVTLRADDPILARLDDLANLHWIKHSPFTTDTAHHNAHGFNPDEVPIWPEQTIRQRVAVLDAATPFDLVYNRVVQAYIDLYVSRKREMSSRMLGLAELYFPVFEEYLDRHGMPLEMKYLAVVESALNPGARSRAGAVGLWQFMLATGKLYGLKADSYIDERHDLHKSTEAACRYLKFLHGLYGNWELALAAYNCGPGNVNKA
ncbi:MAG: lytic transglycosylase domain-containing protein, partial [Flavobacteriales bacterium]